MNLHDFSSYLWSFHIIIIIIINLQTPISQQFPPDKIF